MKPSKQFPVLRKSEDFKKALVANGHNPEDFETSVLEFDGSETTVKLCRSALADAVNGTMRTIAHKVEAYGISEEDWCVRCDALIASLQGTVTSLTWQLDSAKTSVLALVTPAKGDAPASVSEDI